MGKFSANKDWYRKKVFVLLTFCCVTLAMLITRYLGFSTFKGSDDLHYAFLSSRILNGSYDMFFAQDIYSGRVVVVLYQALWFKVFGINDFSMIMPSLSALIALAFLICFKTGLQKDVRTVVLAGTLVYFNPIVTRATLGNLPDAYIALIALLVFLLIKKNADYSSAKQNIRWGIMAGLLLIGGLFVKETIVIIYAGTAFMLIYYRKKISRSLLIALAITVTAGCAVYLLFYFINTGNAFYRFVQINNAAYFNSCSYGCLSNIHLLKRLTITVPLEAIIASAWPLLLTLPVLLTYKQYETASVGFWKISFISLSLLALYFPFSIAPYVPLCHDMRQFFFLFPFVAILYMHCVSESLFCGTSFKKTNIAASIIFAAGTLICVAFTPFNKWSIACSSLLTLSFIINVFSSKKIQQFIFYLAIPAILWLSTAYTVFKKPHAGYQHLKATAKEIQKNRKAQINTFYFLNNDTKTHFALIYQFDTSRQFINLDTIQKGFKPFIAYQPQQALNATIKKGWLIVSEDYMENLDASAIDSIKRLLVQQTAVYKTGNTIAYLLDDAELLQKIMSIINVKNTNSGCY